MKIWINNQLLDLADATVSVYDHGLLYGDGVFEGIRAYGGRIFEERAHIDRLFLSAQKIRLTIPYSKDEIVQAMNQTLAANSLSDAYIRLVVTRGAGNLGLNPFSCPNPSVFIITDHIQLFPRQMYEQGMPVIIAKTVRTSVKMLDPSVKSLNYLNNIMAKLEAVDAGVGEAIMLNDQGNVAEGTGDNVFIIKKGKVLTPPPSAGILLGITRGVVLAIALRLHIPVEEKDITPEDMYGADECFLTGTAAEIIPVRSVDGHEVSGGKPGPITMKLSAAFHEFVRTKVK